MRRDTLCDAISSIEYELIEEYNDLKEKFDRRKNRMKAWLKYSAVAACLALVVCIGFAVAPIFDRGDDSSGDDVAYALYFGNFLYEPIKVGDHAGYPAVKELMIGATSENRYDIREEHLGEYMGVFPGVESLGIPEGKAYHFAAYPDYDSVIIVERNGNYAFYVSEGNVLSEDVAKDSSSALLVHGLPSSATALCDGFDAPLDLSVATELFACLDGKESIDKSAIEQSKYDAWCELYGESGVFFDGKGFFFESEEKHWEFNAFVNEDLHSLWVKTDKGFQNLLIIIDLKFDYFTFCGNSYILSAEECEALAGLLCAE